MVIVFLPLVSAALVLHLKTTGAALSKCSTVSDLSYLFEYNAQNFVWNFNQKLKVRVVHEFFHQHALFLFLNLDTDINVTQEEFEQLFGESDDESSFKL